MPKVRHGKETKGCPDADEYLDGLAKDHNTQDPVMSVASSAQDNGKTTRVENGGKGKTSPNSPLDLPTKSGSGPTTMDSVPGRNHSEEIDSLKNTVTNMSRTLELFIENMNKMCDNYEEEASDSGEKTLSVLSPAGVNITTAVDGTAVSSSAGTAGNSQPGEGSMSTADTHN